MSQEQQRIELLEKDMLGISYRLDNQQEVLKEIRDVLVQQSQILQNVTAIREMVNQVRADVDELEDTFENRKKDTDNAHKDFREYVNKSKGVVLTLMFFFTIIQGTIAFVLKDNYETHQMYQKEIQQLQINQAILKEKLTLREAVKPHQNPPESHNHK